MHRLLIEEGLDIKRELYLSILVDRARGKPVIMASTAGGMEIEEVAHKNPEAILREPIDPATGLQPYQARKLAFGLGLSAELVSVAVPFLQSLYRAFLETDASLLEINPCIVTGDGRLVALDAKVNFDDNALYRHPEFKDLRDLDEEDPLEVEASKYKLNYIKLDGNVGCMVNGAGLAMATMDIIKLSGGTPANFLDVGGGASAEQVKNAFQILMSDPNVKGVFINIFGGILRCDVLASGVVNAAKELKFKMPVVVRMEGTNVEKGQEILRDSGLNFTVANGMKDGAEKIVALAGRCAMSVLVDKKHARHRAGPHRPRRQLPRAADDRIRHQGGRRRHARQRRHEASRRARVQHRGRSGARNRRERVGDFRAAAVRRGRDSRSARRRPAARHLHHRRHSHARHGARRRRAERFEDAADRPELPGNHFARANARSASCPARFTSRATSAS